MDAHPLTGLVIVMPEHCFRTPKISIFESYEQNYMQSTVAALPAKTATVATTRPKYWFNFRLLLLVVKYRHCLPGNVNSVQATAAVLLHCGQPTTHIILRVGCA
jgi:hypothetical protein